ncbi:MAG TPA: ABC transporter permease [Candidatus Pullichristensenella excrementigallinarum]|uniref:ABC transporter permease n=1 Tax=Candidatus Pullichristensenella excrementigallinarum TaxID=2840907 RepID=A0A9D1ICL8_9FIRM|nr:ABC transporter permease [Candidatus Pullichristensenella excrementigallinarum]
MNKPYAGKSAGRRIAMFAVDHVIEILLILLVLIMWASNDRFMTLANWLSILKNQSLKGMIAFGMTMVIVTGQIDLSVGSTVAFAGAIAAWCSRNLVEMWGISSTAACVVGILLALLAAAAFGALFAVSQHKLAMPAFLVTLVGQYAMFGLAGMICGGYPIDNALPNWLCDFASGRISGIRSLSYQAILLLIVFGVTFYIMEYTTTGRNLYATGGNPESARLSGIDVLHSKLVAFIAIQLLAAVAGILHSGQVNSASHTYGKGWEADAIIAAVIGGTSMAGGVGKIWGTFCGILFLGVVTNGMTILNLSVYMQYVVQAFLLFIAVLISTYRVAAKSHLES